MENGVVVNLREMSEYINAMDRLFEEMFVSQSMVNISYNVLKPQWYDKVSILTAHLLYKTEKEIEKIDNYFYKLFTILNEGYEHLDREYAGNNDWDGIFHAKELGTKLNVEEQTMTKQINGTTVEGIKSFERELTTYIKDTRENVSKVYSAYEGMGIYWRDNKYRETGEEINNFCFSMNRNMQELEELLSWIVERRKQFEEAMQILARRPD